MVKGGDYAPRKAAKHSLNDDPSSATLEHLAALNSLPSNLLSKILSLTGRPAAFATVCR